MSSSVGRIPRDGIAARILNQLTGDEPRERAGGAVGSSKESRLKADALKFIKIKDFIRSNSGAAYRVVPLRPRPRPRPAAGNKRALAKGRARLYILPRNSRAQSYNYCTRTGIITTRMNRPQRRKKRTAARKDSHPLALSHPGITVSRFNVGSLPKTTVLSESCALSERYEFVERSLAPRE